MDRPRWDRKNEPLSEYEARREAYVVHHRMERNRPRVIERTETVKEIVTEHDDSEMRERIAFLEREARESADMLAYLAQPGEAEPDAPPEKHRFPASLDERLVDYGDPAAEADLTTDDLLTSMRSDAAVTEDVVQRLSRAKRKKFTELLNVELAELQQERGGPKENLKRENEIEALKDLFSRVGEM